MGALSKGCAACKKSKVKCDGKQPTCARCRRIGIECTGSTLRLRFIDEKPRIRRSIAVSHAQSCEFRAITQGSSSLNVVAFHSGRIGGWGQTSSISPTTTPFSTITLPLTAFKDNICISYLLSKFFDGEDRVPFNSTRESTVLPLEWVPELVKTTQPLHRRSWDALAAIAFGKAHKTCEVIQTAFGFYGEALSELRNQLSRPKELKTESMFASMTALYIYEILAWKADKRWMIHANGLSWLLESRGPWQQKSSIGKSIFLEHRIMLTAKSIISGQSTFLRNPAWKTVPWEDDPSSKLPIDYLVDIGADIAECIASIKTFNNKNTAMKHCHSSAEYSNFKNQVASSLQDLNAWWSHWEAENGHCAIEISAFSQETTPFSTLLQFNTLWQAFTVSTYAAMRILLLQLWYYLLQNSPHLPLSNINSQIRDENVVLDVPNLTPLQGISSSTTLLASEILRSLSYCYSCTHRFITTVSFLFIQDVAYGCFCSSSEEARWAARHGWAEVVKDGMGGGDIRDENLLNRLVPLGQMKIEGLLWGTTGEPLGFGSL